MHENGCQRVYNQFTLINFIELIFFSSFTGYVKRLQTASQICKKYPDQNQRKLYVRQNLLERKCAFVLKNFKK